MQFVNFCSLFGKFGSFYLSLSSRDLHFIWQNHALRHISGMTVAFMDAFEPLASMIGSIIVFHFRPQMLDYVASIMIIFAVIALNWTPRVKVKARVNK